MLLCDLIIPAQNEIENIDPLFDALSHFIESGAVRRIILVDNGSTDGTGEAAAERGAMVLRENLRGYGVACLRALNWIREHGDPPAVVVFLDADLSDDPLALPDLLNPLHEGAVDFVIGSRVKNAETGALNFVQRFGNGLACFLMRLTTGRRYGDLGPFRAIRWTTLEQLNMQDRTWGWTVEMQMKAALLNIPFAEVQVPYRKRRHGRSKISGTMRGVIAAGTKIISTIFILWIKRNRIRKTGAVHICSSP